MVVWIPVVDIGEVVNEAVVPDPVVARLPVVALSGEVVYVKEVPKPVDARIPVVVAITGEVVMEVALAEAVVIQRGTNRIHDFNHRTSKFESVISNINVKLSNVYPK